MAANICPCCRMPIDDSADCKVCGFANVIIPKMTDDMEKKIEHMAAQYRVGQKLNGVKASFKAYSHEKKDGKLVEKDVVLIPFFDAADLSFESFEWLPDNFARVDTDETLTLNLELSGSSGERDIDLPFKAPALDDFWHIGVKLVPGLKAQIAIGNESVHTLLDPVDLI